MPYDTINYDSQYNSSYDYTVYDTGFIFNDESEEETELDSYDA